MSTTEDRPMNANSNTTADSNSLFRKESLDKISSPEQLNDYLHVATPGLWILMAGIVVFLLGVLAWGIFGAMESRVEIGAVVQDDQLTAYVTEETFEKIGPGAEIQLGSQTIYVDEVGRVPVQASKVMDDFQMTVTNVDDDDWVYPITAKADLDDGEYKASIVEERIRPMSLIMN